MPLAVSLKGNRWEKPRGLSHLVPVAQRIEQTSPKGKMEVQFPPGTPDTGFLLALPTIRLVGETGS